MTVLDVIDASVGTVLLSTGTVAWLRRRDSRIGLLLVLTGVTWFAAYLWAGLALLHRGPLAHVHLSHPTGRVRGRLATGSILLAYTAAIADGFGATPWLSVALAVLVAVSAARQFGTVRGAAQAAARPALLTALAFAAVVLAGALNELAGWQQDVLVLLGYEVVVAVVAVVLVVDLIRGRWTEVALADLVTDIGHHSATGLQSQLRRALSDPTLTIGYWHRERNAYLDETGREPIATDDQAVTLIADDRGPLARVVHDRELLNDPAWTGGADSVVRLALRNIRLQRDIEAGLAELRASRRRIVAAGDEQAHLLSERLMKGPLTQLTGAERLVLECGSLNGERQGLLAEFAAVRAELDAVVRGNHPPTLAAGGLAAALPELAAHSAVPVDVAVLAPRLQAQTEAALYYCCAEALTNLSRHARATRARVEVTAEDEAVRLLVEDDGVGGADIAGSGLRGLADRVEALDGALEIQSPPGGGTRLVVRMPNPRIEQS